jgi:mono/diheme cytochrome c family protein
VECHLPNGSGTPPDFPALAGNENLSEAALLVRNVHQGKGAMPAFPHLTAEQIAAVGTYIRNDWGNQFGAISADEVEALLAALPPPVEAASIWSGLSNQEQADRGRSVYSGVCAKCHGRTGNGAGDPDQPESPSVARAAFLTKWEGQSLATLFEYVRTTMPIDNPGSRTDQEYIDAIVHMMVLSNVPLADTELPPDPEALAGYVLEPEPAQ